MGETSSIPAAQCNSRYCYIFEQQPSNHELDNPDLGGPVHPCERLIWVELMQLCHNCFSPSHPAEKCTAPSQCKCIDNLCQCEVKHSHNQLICGRDFFAAQKDFFKFFQLIYTAKRKIKKKYKVNSFDPTPNKTVIVMIFIKKIDKLYRRELGIIF